MTDEAVELTDQDQEDLHRLYTEPDAEPPIFHTILQVWHEVLKVAPDEATKKITPQYATRICAEYNQLRFADMNAFRDSYFGKLAELYAILEAEIATDTDCLTYTEPADDARENSHHYKNLLLVWQQAILSWELAWECTQPDAAIEIAAISEVHKMFFGPTGLTAFLDNIGFEFTDDDATLLQAELRAFRGETSE